MKSIFINTAGRTTCVAVFCNQKSEFYVDPDGKKASEALLPIVDELLGKAGLTLSELDSVVCVVGPGSFTGIRIGVGTARAICYALGKSAGAVSFNEAIASVEKGRRIAVISGWANNFYLAEYDGDSEILPPTAMEKEVAERYISERAECLLLCDENSSVAFNGECVPFEKYALNALLSAKMGDFTILEPLYAMKSQAERELNK